MTAQRQQSLAEQPSHEASIDDSDLCLLAVTRQRPPRRSRQRRPQPRSPTKAEQELTRSLQGEVALDVGEKVDTLAALFHDEAVFVHMGST